QRAQVGDQGIQVRGGQLAGGITDYFVHRIRGRIALGGSDSLGRAPPPPAQRPLPRPSMQEGAFSLSETVEAHPQLDLVADTRHAELHAEIRALESTARI